MSQQFCFNQSINNKSFCLSSSRLCLAKSIPNHQRGKPFRKKQLLLQTFLCTLGSSQDVKVDQGGHLFFYFRRTQCQTILSGRICLTKMKEKQNAWLQAGRYVLSGQESRDCFDFISDVGIRAIYLSLDYWLCQIRTTRLIMIFTSCTNCCVFSGNHGN